MQPPPCFGGGGPSRMDMHGNQRGHSNSFKPGGPFPSPPTPMHSQATTFPPQPNNFRPSDLPPSGFVPQVRPMDLGKKKRKLSLSSLI